MLQVCELYTFVMYSVEYGLLGNSEGDWDDDDVISSQSVLNGRTTR